MTFVRHTGAPIKRYEWFNKIRSNVHAFARHTHKHTYVIVCMFLKYTLNSLDTRKQTDSKSYFEKLIPKIIIINATIPESIMDTQDLGKKTSRKW